MSSDKFDPWRTAAPYIATCQHCDYTSGHSTCADAVRAKDEHRFECPVRKQCSECKKPVDAQDNN